MEEDDVAECLACRKGQSVTAVVRGMTRIRQEKNRGVIEMMGKC